jgi:hypothetical protein
MKCEDDLFVITNRLKRDLHGLAGDISNLKRIIDNCKISGEKLRFSHYFNFDGYTKNIINGFSNQLAQNITGVTPYNYSKMFGKMMADMLVSPRAGGGNVSSGAAYLVGERGPELFVPTVSGNVISNNQLNSSANGRPINLVMNINASDGESFRKSQSQIMAEIIQALRHANRNL